MNAGPISTVWLIDPVHSSIRFEARYLLLSSVSGRFTQFEGRVVTRAADFDQSLIQLKVYTNSIQSGYPERDDHLKSPDFFDTRQYPVMSFYSTSVQGHGDSLQVTGNLSIRDRMQSVAFTAHYTGQANDEIGNRKAGFELSLELHRRDFGLHWNRVLDNAGLLVSDTIKVFCEIQLLEMP